MRWGALTLALGFLLGACGNSLGPGEEGRVRVAFQVASSNGSGDPLVINGSNGTLRITDIRLIVNEFELEAVGVNCPGVADTDDDEADCEEFEAPPAFVQLALNGDSKVVVSTPVPAGAYQSLEFEVEDVDVDEPDDNGNAIQTVAAAVHAAFPNWPDEASMVVVGTFTPTGGQPIPFTVFFEAELEIEKDFNPPFVVDQNNEIITVELDPSLWFRRFDGTVLNLSAFDFATTHQVLDFEAELDNGFFKVEVDD